MCAHRRWPSNVSAKKNDTIHTHYTWFGCERLALRRTRAEAITRVKYQLRNILTIVFVQT